VKQLQLRSSLRSLYFPYRNIWNETVSRIPLLSSLATIAKPLSASACSNSNVQLQRFAVFPSFDTLDAGESASSSAAPLLPLPEAGESSTPLLSSPVSDLFGVRDGLCLGGSCMGLLGM
jgi:hypothetical protein